MTLPLRPGVFLLLPLLVVVALSGCAKPRIELAVASQANVNPDHSGRPSPVIVKMYEIRGDLAFQQSDFQTLFNSPMQSLGADLVAADEIVFIPGEAKTIAYEPMAETRFVGIVAGFRQMERAVWRTVVPVDPEKKNVIKLELNDVSLLVHSDNDDWSPADSVNRARNRFEGQPSVSDVAAQGSSAPGQPQQEAAQNALAQQQGYVLPHARRTP